MMTSCPYLKRLAPAFCVFLTLWAAAAGAGDTDLRARRILDTADVQGGLVVHLGCGDGQATASLLLNNRFLVHGLEQSRQVRSARMEYFDGPVIGVLAWVTTIPLEESPER